MTDQSFIRLYKNDLALAKKSDDPNIAKLLYGGFIIQKPNETFLQISSGDIDISFVGGIKVDLIDSCGNVKKNLDDNFYYENVVDSNGVSQIAFEFGLIGTDYFYVPLHLKITDLINDNIWYSNSFLVTYLNSDLSTRFDYFNRTKLYNISYDLLPYTQSIRFVNCYDQSPANKEEAKQYITSQGLELNYRQITTFKRKYVIESLDYAINDRFYGLKNHQQVYCNGQRVTISEYKVDERKGDTNFLSGEFLINPQGQKFNLQNQLFEALELISVIPSGIYTSQIPVYPNRTFNNIFALPFGSNGAIINNKKFNNKFSDVFGA
tara:strand:+ start:2973 stop:3938 length:966 start_codon:yes stop_codon:yes gene_type:complete